MNLCVDLSEACPKHAGTLSLRANNLVLWQGVLPCLTILGQRPLTKRAEPKCSIGQQSYDAAHGLAWSLVANVPEGRSVQQG